MAYLRWPPVPFGAILRELQMVTSDPEGSGRRVIYEFHTELTWQINWNGYFGQMWSSVEGIAETNGDKTH